MKLKIYNHQVKGFAVGYTLWLSANDTYNWAHRPRHRWPCSTLSNKRLRIDVDNSGLSDLTVNGKPNLDNIDAIEFDALVSHFTVNTEAMGLWPIWAV
jgi:hypothetical protein